MKCKFYFSNLAMKFDFDAVTDIARVESISTLRNFFAYCMLSSWIILTGEVSVS